MYSRQRTISTHSNSSNGNGNSARPALVPKLQQPVTLSESVQVTVRCRPPKKDELNNCWNLSDNKISSEDPKLKKQHQFTFDNVFYGSNNTELYSKSVESQAMEGFNATVFAYGQTASGKTFTMIRL
ncbi:hypothetical protein MFLAVUS_003924 [Mucor flavus]|uniref:Kinesin motor domain-containing protein n=1 Tax=Mucor flavus TaxID=439312 RepID=A0ABP9YUI6_9FUNG